jgi:ABC-type sugar transport system ATPase subunit
MKETMHRQEPILSITDVSKSFPGVKALNSVSFEINKGEIHSIVGENGAGKSTLTKVITGIHQRDRGTIYYDGKEINYKHISESMVDKIYLVFQELSLCSNLTVSENIFLGKLELKFPSKSGLISKRLLMNEADKHLKSLGIEQMDVRERVERMEVAEQQLVEIAKALVMKPKLLILDEPTSALTENEAANLFSLMRRLQKDGVTIILISHIIEDVFTISDRITILRDGEHVATKKKEDITMDEIVRLMVGRKIQEVEVHDLRSEEILLEVCNLESSKLQKVSLSLRKGEILGLMGLQGSGNAELLRCIFGSRKTRGEIIVNGKKCSIRQPLHAIRNGIIYVPADRKNEGIIDSLDLGFNLGFLNLRKYQRFGLVIEKKIYEIARSIAERLGIRYTRLQQNPYKLSGGNQQKAVIGKALGIDPRIVLLDDPTRGVDIGAKNEIYKIILSMSEKGKGILFLSTELPELLSLCHRIIVFFNGRMVGEFVRGEATEETLMLKACGLG